MKILHTADWHLGAMLGRQPRSDDLKRGVEQVFDYCEQEAVDVLLIAGDLFHKGAWSDEVCHAVEHLKEVSRSFLRSGGTILALTGNHDHETVCATLRHALELSSPSEARFGRVWSPGRFYLATRSTFFRLSGRDGREVQFVLMPYPTPTRYLDGESTPYGGAEEKHRRLLDAFLDLLSRMRAHAEFDRSLHTVLAAHLYMSGVTLSNGHSVTEADDLVCPADDLGAGWAYVALGHVHKPQSVGGLGHVRYSGSLDRITLDEREDPKGVVLFEIGAGGLRSDPVTLPLNATPMLDVVVANPEEDLPRLEAEYGATGRAALVRCRVAYRSGQDDLDAILRRLGALFPRSYKIDPVDVGRPSMLSTASGECSPGRGFHDTVLGYVTSKLKGQEIAADVRAAAEALLTETTP